MCWTSNENAIDFSHWSVGPDRRNISRSARAVVLTSSRGLNLCAPSLRFRPVCNTGVWKHAWHVKCPVTSAFQPNTVLVMDFKIMIPSSQHHPLDQGLQFSAMFTGKRALDCLSEPKRLRDYHLKSTAAPFHH